MEETFKYGFYIPVEMACNSTDAVWTDRLLFPGVNQLNVRSHTAHSSPSCTVSHLWRPAESQRRSFSTSSSSSTWRTARWRFRQWWQRRGPTELSTARSVGNKATQNRCTSQNRGSGFGAGRSLSCPISPPGAAFLSRDQRHVVLIDTDSGFWCNLKKKILFGNICQETKRISILRPSNFKSTWKNSRCEKERYHCKDGVLAVRRNWK